jgi:glucose-6-phosphate 1-dehydrogenase
VAMDAPETGDGQAVDAAKLALLKAVRPLQPADVVRGQYRGYRGESGVAPDSCVETYVAAQLAIENTRWSGVPFLIRAGKSLAATVTEVQVILKPPAKSLFDSSADGRANRLCFRLSPDVSITLTTRIKTPGEAMTGEEASLVEHRQAGDEMAPYERLLGDALRGDHSLFGSEAGVEAAWRIVDPILTRVGPPCEYDSGSWGPAEAERIAAASGGWIAPAFDGSDVERER